MAERRIIDLSFTIREGMTTFPSHWHPMVEITQLGRHGIENRETRKFTMGTHTGTHCDAPRHFIPGGRTIEDMSLEPFIGPATVLDFSSAKPLQEIGPVELKKAVGVCSWKRLILRFDWSDHWGSMDYYRNHPFLSEEAANLLVEKGTLLLAMDTPQPDSPKQGFGSAVDSPIHKILLGKEVVLVEYLCNLRSLSQKEVELLVLPLKLAEGDGAPVRCVAIEYGDNL